MLLAELRMVEVTQKTPQGRQMVGADDRRRAAHAGLKPGEPQVQRRPRLLCGVQRGIPLAAPGFHRRAVSGAGEAAAPNMLGDRAGGQFARCLVERRRHAEALTSLGRLTDVGHIAPAGQFSSNHRMAPSNLRVCRSAPSSMIAASFLESPNTRQLTVVISTLSSAAYDLARATR